MEWNQIHNTEEMDACLDAQIKKTRVHPFQVQLLDPLGSPCRGVAVKAVHKDHDFMFGVCPNGHISMTNHLACGDGPEAETYWKRIGDLFNATTLWWGWRVLEPERGKRTFDCERNGYGPMERMAERAEKLGHRLTAHAILYPREDLSPAWLSECGETEALGALKEHVQETVERYKNRISCWHPVNEAYNEPQQVGGLRVNEGLVYRWIGDLAPHGELVNNGGHTIDPDFYEKGLQNAERFGGRVDDLGVRGYFELYDSEALEFYKNMWNHYGNLADRYHRGVRVTEIGAVSAPRKGTYNPWDVDHTTAKLLGISDFDEFRKDQPITEETQAVFVTRMYKLAFAHPKVKECSYWDLCDSYTWNEVEGGLVWPDLSPKLAYHKLRELIHETWSTQAECVSDGRGICRFEGFDGEYEITVGGHSYRLHLNGAKADKVLCIC